MPRPIEALVHLDALAANLRRARAAAPEARLFAVVKADAYGHGLEHVYPALSAADGFALLDLAEAERVRALGWRGPILLLEGCFSPRDLDACSRLALWHVVHREAQIDWLASHVTARPHHVFLKCNSGMNRLGFAPPAMRAAWLRLDALPQVEHVTPMTHFANADLDAADAARIAPHASAEAARATFEAAVDGLPGDRSVCNSAALLRHGGAWAGSGWVRPGILLYGSSPDHPVHDVAHWGLQPAMTLRSELIAVQALEAGAVVGYGSRYTATASMRIGVVACGYADGYPRSAPGGVEHGAPVLVDGVRTRLVGRVSMDMVTVDLTPVPAATVGSEVVLWGRAASGAVLSIDEVAAACGTLGYELMCARAPRVPVRAVA